MKINSYWFVLVISLTVLALCAHSVWADPDAVFAQQYVHARNQLTEAPGNLANLSEDESSGTPVARTYEVCGKVVGQVTSNGAPIVIIACSNDVSVEFSAPQEFLDSSSDWMGTGNAIRILAKSVVAADGSAGTGVLQLVAAGPEDAIRALETQLSVLENQLRQRITSRDYPQETSRGGQLSSRFVMSSGPVTGLSDRASAIYPAYRYTVARLNPRLSSADVEYITKSILAYSDEYQLDPRLIIAMIIAESGFDPNSVSSTGAIGLGQLMPETAAELGVSNPYDPQQNIAAAVHILSSRVQNYGGAAPCGVVPLNTLLLTMAAYNAGPGAVKKYGGVPPYRETQRYVRKVSQLYRELCGS